MSELNERILEAVILTGEKMDDYGQRSALGMARSWIDNNHKAIEREKNPLDKYDARDDLAEELVKLLDVAHSQGVTREEMIAALAHARAVVNAPFLNPDMNGQKMNRQTILKPGEFKKASEGRP